METDVKYNFASEKFMNREHWTLGEGFYRKKNEIYGYGRKHPFAF